MYNSKCFYKTDSGKLLQKGETSVTTENVGFIIDRILKLQDDKDKEVCISAGMTYYSATQANGFRFMDLVSGNFVDPEIICVVILNAIHLGLEVTYKYFDIDKTEKVHTKVKDARQAYAEEIMDAIKSMTTK